MNEEVPSGYVVPIRRSLTENIRVAGVPLLYVIGFLAVGYVCTLTWGLPLLLGPLFLLFLCVRWAFKLDPQIDQVLMDNSTKKMEV